MAVKLSKIRRAAIGKKRVSIAAFDCNVRLPFENSYLANGLKREYHQLLRLLSHLLLAVFVASAANKFFVVDLDIELQHGFYARIFAFHGDAPDQYRILTLLPLKYLCGFLSFNHAVLVYNFCFGFIALELFWALSKGMSDNWRKGVSFGFSILYIFTQYTGWRPDTMGVLVLSLGTALLLRDMRDASLRWLLYGVFIALMSFCRAEIALIYALFATFYRKWNYAVFIPIPIVAQVLLQEFIFPNATYYSATVMFWDNLRLHYILNNPATYLIGATLLVFWSQVVAFIRQTFRKSYYFYLSMIGFGLLILVIARLNEYRLYLPIVPLVFLINDGRNLPERGK